MYNMKNYIISSLLGLCVLCSSCNDEWKDELYTEMISFKATPGSNGVHDIYMRYQPDGTSLNFQSLSVGHKTMPAILM